MKTKIFLQKGLDSPFRKTRSDLPVGQKRLAEFVIARSVSDEAIHTCLASIWIASRSLSSGGAEPVIGRAFARPVGADPLARNDDGAATSPHGEERVVARL